MVGSKLNLKLVRDLKFSPFLFGGIVMLAVVGIALFGASYELYMNLESSYALSYDKLNLADFTVSVQSAPEDVLNTLRGIPGVRDVTGRVIEDTEIDQPESANRKVIGRVISLPDSGEPRVNQVKLISGSYPKRDASRDLLLEASFAKYHKYKPGDVLRVVIQGDKVRFRISGIVQSAEYIYAIQTRENPMPNPRGFGVMWMRKAMADKLFGTSGSVNDISFRMASGGNRRTAMRSAAKVLKPYGADDPVPQENQPSVEMLRLDLIGLQGMAVFFPLLFLTIASLSTYNLLSRMVHAQRSQIGFMRAVGFSSAAVGWHYAQFSILIGAIGGAVGGLLGHYTGILVTKYYMSFLQVPYYDTSPRWGVVGAGFAISLVVTTVAGLMPALHAAKLPPAQAIGAEVPTGGRAPVIENYLTFLRRFSLLARLPLRNFMRSPKRSLSTVAGVASAATLILVSCGLLDSTVATIDFYFKRTLHFDVMATYLHPQDQVALERIRRWKGVERVEPVLIVPAKLVKGDRSQTTVMYGVDPGTRLFTITNRQGEKLALPKSGLMVGDFTAGKLGLWQGGTVRLTLPKKTVAQTPELAAPGSVTGMSKLEQMLNPASYRETMFAPSRALLETKLDRDVRVSGVNYRPIGNATVASIDQIRRWYGRALELPPKAITGAALKVDDRYLSEVERKLYDLDGVGSVQVRKHMVEEIDEMMKQSNVFFNVMLAFSISLAAVIMFNSTIMNVIERTREIATLRTVGVGARAAAWMVCAENLMAYVCGMIVGLPLGTYVARQFVQMYDSESFHMQAVIFPMTYVYAVVGILLTIVLAQIPGLRYIRRMELARATKDVG